MTHYRLTLAIGEGASVEIVAEVHKDTPRLDQGWGRKMRASPFVSARIRQCGWPDADCKPFQAWLQSKDEATDDAEAERLRNEDLKEAGA